LFFVAGLSVALSVAQDANHTKASHPKKLKLRSAQRSSGLTPVERSMAVAHSVPEHPMDAYRVSDREQYRAPRCEELRAQLAAGKESKR
jgi:hypothetical protein